VHNWQSLAQATTSIMILLTYFLPALLCLNRDVLATARRPPFEPLPVCADCVPREDIIAAGIGFDLTTSYATAAIRFHHGSIETLAKVGLSCA